MKRLSKLIAVILSAAIILSSFGMSASAFSMDDVKVTAEHTLSKVIEGLLSTVFGGLASIIPDGKNFKPLDEYESSGFIQGSDEFLSEPAEDAVWRLGASDVSLVPDDYKEKNYYLGGYIMFENWFTNKVEDVIDDMKARVIAIDDGSGRGTAVFATIDCIGITNGDIKCIRERLIEKAGDKYDFSGITVCSTHAHSGIDTQGLWTNLFKKAPLNLIKSLFRAGKLETGVDSEYMSFLYEKVSDAMLKACDSMEKGTMTYAVKDISDQYFTNKNRSSASALITDMNRFVFRPYKKSSTPTMICNVAAHPDVAGLPTSDGQGNGRQVSGDYIYYMGDIINRAGYNFMFFNGAIAGIYMSRGASNDNQTFNARYEQSMRYGYELGRMALSMTLTKDEIKENELLGLGEETIAKETAIAEENGGKYTLWYEDWTPVKERTVEPLFNIRFKEVALKVSNRFIETAGKLNLANYSVLKKDKGYYIVSEIGFMQIGDVKIALMPGEVCQDLVVGGTSLHGDTAFSGKDFEGKTIVDIFGEDTIAFGLANDAIGYVIPDNDYCMCIAFDHYHELISLGKGTASTIMAGFEELASEIDTLYK